MVHAHIDESAVPGTVHLVDLEGILSGHLGNKDIVLVPRPSKDPEDPLNWTRARKFINLACVMMYCPINPPLSDILAMS
jgi:hypothetical protein